MSENQYLETRLVAKYKEPKMKIIAYIISFLYLLLVCVPIFLFVYCLVTITFWIIDIKKFYKKTIKNAKAKFKPKPSQSVS